MHTNTSARVSPQAHRAHLPVTFWRQLFALVDAWYDQTWVIDQMHKQCRTEVSEHEYAYSLSPHLRRDLGLPPL